MQLLAQTSGRLGVGDLNRYSLRVTWPTPNLPESEPWRVVVQVSNTTPAYKNLAVQSGPYALSATVEARRALSSNYFETPLSGSSATSSPQSTPPHSIGRSSGRAQSTPQPDPGHTNFTHRSASPANSQGSARSYQRLKQQLKRFTRFPPHAVPASNRNLKQPIMAHTAMIIIGGQSWKAAFTLNSAEQPEALFDIEIVSEVNHTHTHVQYTLKAWLDHRAVESGGVPTTSNQPGPLHATSPYTNFFSQRWRHWIDTMTATPAFSDLGRSLWVAPNADTNHQPQCHNYHRGRGRSISDPQIAVIHRQATVQTPPILGRRHSDHGDQLWLASTTSRRAQGSENPGQWLYPGTPAIDFADDGHQDAVSHHGYTADYAVRGTLVLTHTTASVFEDAPWRSDPDAWTELNRPAHLVVLSHGLMGSRLDELYLYEAIQRRYDPDERGGNNNGMTNPYFMESNQRSPNDPPTGGYHNNDECTDDRKLPMASAVRILAPSCNHGRTSDGIDVCGLRLAQAILEAVQWEANCSYYQQVAEHTADLLRHASPQSHYSSANDESEDVPFTDQHPCASVTAGTTERSSLKRHRISFIGHSLGGLINLNCLCHLDRLTDGQFFLAFDPVHFVTLATPYLGISENYSVINQACRWGVMGQTGKELAYLHSHNPFKRMLHFDEILVSTTETVDTMASSAATGPTQRRSACLARVQHELSQLESEPSSDASDTNEQSMLSTDSPSEPAKRSALFDFRWALSWPRSLRSSRSSHRPVHSDRQQKRPARLVKRDNILLHMCRYDQPYIQLLSRFQSRTTYANVDNDVSVGFYTAGLVYTDFDRAQFLARLRQTTFAKLHNASKLLWNRTLQLSEPVLNHCVDPHCYRDTYHQPQLHTDAEQPVLADDPVQEQVAPVKSDIVSTLPPIDPMSADTTWSNSNAQAMPDVSTVASRVSARVQTGYRSLLQLMQSAGLNRGDSRNGWQHSMHPKENDNGPSNHVLLDEPVLSSGAEHGSTDMSSTAPTATTVWHQSPIVHDERVDTEQLVTRLIPQLAESYPRAPDAPAVTASLTNQPSQAAPTTETLPPTVPHLSNHSDQDHPRADTDQKQHFSSPSSYHHGRRHHHRHPIANGTYPHWIAHLALGFHMPGLSWRKVHVYFATDAHNQIIARRRFYQRSGAPVIAHLLEHHPL